jgi:hypothetical protein
VCQEAPQGGKRRLITDGGGATPPAKRVFFRDGWMDERMDGSVQLPVPVLDRQRRGTITENTAYMPDHDDVLYVYVLTCYPHRQSIIPKKMIWKPPFF